LIGGEIAFQGAGRVGRGRGAGTGCEGSDKDKAGKLIRDYYTTHQSDAAAAGERFTKWDTDKDGLLSREEYLKQGK
jgi:hypothetical protein